MTLSPFSGVTFNTAPRSSGLAPSGATPHIDGAPLPEPFKRTLSTNKQHKTLYLALTTHKQHKTLDWVLSTSVCRRGSFCSLFTSTCTASCFSNLRYAKSREQPCAVAQSLQLGRENWFGVGCMHRRRKAICKSCKKSNSDLLPRRQVSVSVKS